MNKYEQQLTKLVNDIDLTKVEYEYKQLGNRDSVKKYSFFGIELYHQRLFLSESFESNFNHFLGEECISNCIEILKTRINDEKKELQIKTLDKIFGELK